MLLRRGSQWPGLGEGSRARHLKSSLGAAHTRLQAVLVAGSALEGFEGIREAVAEHGHLAAMAHGARNEGEASAGLAQLRVLDPLEETGRWIVATFLKLATMFCLIEVSLKFLFWS